MTLANLRPVAFAACTLWPLAALAQDQAPDHSIPVFFIPLNGGEFTPLNKAIQTALSQAPLKLVAKPSAGVLVITVPDKVDVEHKKVSGTFYSFTVAFSRNGDSLGQSAQSCNADKLSDCTDQLVLDVKSVAAPR